MKNNAEMVTLTRAAYDALIKRVEEADDLAVVAAAGAREEMLGKTAARADYLPIELVRRLDGGEHPIRVWRMHRGLSGDALAAAAEIATGRLEEIETRRSPGSFTELAKLANALGVSLDGLAAWIVPQEA